MMDGRSEATSGEFNSQDVANTLWEFVTKTFSVNNPDQASIKLCPAGHLACWIFSLVQKDSNAKKESFCCTEP
jgi:hypothetical protein